MVYQKYSDKEILGSLSVKLEFDVEVIAVAATEDERRPLLKEIYEGLRQLGKANNYRAVVLVQEWKRLQLNQRSLPI